MNGFKFEIITGPMSCGKTEELLRRLKRAEIANRKLKVFSPSIDIRTHGDIISSRNGLYKSAIKVSSSAEIMFHVSEEDEVIGIDELQFFDSDIVNVILELVKQGKKVIGTGLDLDFKREPFGPMPQLLCYADRVDKLTAICMKCASEYGNRTQRLINGEAADRNSPLIMVGGNETYEARCSECYELKEEENFQYTKKEKMPV